MNNHAGTVLMVHNRYRYRGGEDSVFEAESNLLESNGHSVHRLVFDNVSIPDDRSSLASASLAQTTIWSRKAAARIREEVRKHEPDVVHFHNTFPLVSPAGYYAAREGSARVVQTLHNYRLICPNSLLFREDSPCEACVGKKLPLSGIRHKCYRDSRSASTVVTLMVAGHRLYGTWQNAVDQYVALTDFSRQKFIQGGLPAEKIAVKPNFLDTPITPNGATRKSFLVVGRLDASKGIEDVLSAWSDHEVPFDLRIAGTGPLKDRVEQVAACNPQITYLGQLDSTGVIEEMRSAFALILPTRLYENFPMSLVEAFACGRPAIAPRHGALAEIIEDGRTGMLFAPGDASDLACKIRWAAENQCAVHQMGVVARCEYEQKYTGAHNYRQLMQIYGWN